MEAWKVVEGWTKYEVSSLGRVRRGTRALKGTVDRDGYVRFNLRQGAKRKVVGGHTLVLSTFVRERRSTEVCRHLDGNPANNRLDNLRWGSPVENTRDAIAHGTLKRGEGRSFLYKGLSNEDVLYMRDAVATTRKTIKDLSQEFGLHEGYVRAVVNGTKWKHLPGAFKRTTSGKKIESA